MADILITFSDGMLQKQVNNTKKKYLYNPLNDAGWRHPLDPLGYQGHLRRRMA